MVKLLVYIKHHLYFIWRFVEWTNSVLFALVYDRQKVDKYLETLFGRESFNICSYKVLSIDDMPDLSCFFDRQPKSAFDFFHPHGFDLESLKKKNHDNSFIMIGAYKENQIIGYCFLRCFLNRHAFRGKIVDPLYQGLGIAKQMGRITMDTCVFMNFHLNATISKDNVKSIASSKSVNRIKVLKEMSNGYLYVEYLPKT